MTSRIFVDDPCWRRAGDAERMGWKGRNLNVARMDDKSAQGRSLSDPACAAGTTVCHFRDIESALIGYIRQADYVFGCVAWLTHAGILDAMTQCKGVSIVVQKEDFLRPDVDARESTWKRTLLQRYERLPIIVDRYSLPFPLAASLSVCCDPEIAPVRCVGNYNRDKSPASPRMHHKFVVFAKKGPGCQKGPLCEPQPDGCWLCSCGEEAYQPRPYAVWTGSFNFTMNAGRSLENGLYITDPAIVAAYGQEYAQVLALSESLNWEVDWVSPGYRIGS